MQKYQADQGWQTKLMPDSRALKKLGLGPDYSTAINAKTASFVDPPPVSTIPSEQACRICASRRRQPLILAAAIFPHIPVFLAHQMKWPPEGGHFIWSFLRSPLRTGTPASPSTGTHTAPAA